MELRLSSPRSSLAAIARLTRKDYNIILLILLQVEPFYNYGTNINNRTKRIITIRPYNPTPQRSNVAKSPHNIINLKGLQK